LAFEDLTALATVDERVACNRDVEDCVLVVAIHQLAGNRTRPDEFENEIEVFG
jgi:hypothetical protein